jgi:sterol 3beta-glucosyltransferase
MRITVLAAGSRGDVQPYIALGLELQAAGHHVRLAAFRNFAPLAADYGLGFFPVEADFQAIMGGEDGQSMAASGRNILRFARGIGRTVGPILKQLGNDFWHACQGADAILSGLNGVPFFGYEFAEKLGVPCVNASLLPLLRTRAWANPMWPLSVPLGPGYNLVTHTLVAQLGWQLFRSAINGWRRDVLDLPPVALKGDYERIARLPMLIGISPRVIAKPDDWPALCTLTGYWFLPRSPDWQPAEELLRFIEAGPPPIAVSFGSMSDRRSDTLTQAVIEALRATRQRGILITAWGGLHGIDRPSTGLALMVDAVPFDWLLPQCAVVVHHGGAGSTAASLRAGLPTIVVPFFADQPFWGRRVYDLGVGPKPIPRKQLTVERLAEAISQGIHDEANRARAAALGQQIRSEDGPRRAVELFEQAVSGR